AAPAMATKLTPAVALNPTGAEPHVEADGKAPRRRARNRDGGRGNGGCALSAGGCGGLGTAPLQRVAESLFQRHDRRVAQERLRLRDVGLRVLDVAGALFLVDRLQRCAD